MPKKEKDKELSTSDYKNHIESFIILVNLLLQRKIVDTDKYSKFLEVLKIN
jgi:hypothetical protein